MCFGVSAALCRKLGPAIQKNSNDFKRLSVNQTRLHMLSHAIKQEMMKDSHTTECSLASCAIIFYIALSCNK